MAISLRSMASQFMLPGTLRHVLLGNSTAATSISSPFRTGGFVSQLLPIALPTSISLQLPTLGSIWDSILKAVPKKKTSHRKRRQRLLAGKALKDVTNLEKCPGCGSVKRTQHLCPFCVREIQDIWRGRGTVEAETALREKKKEAMEGWRTVKERRETNRMPRR